MKNKKSKNPHAHKAKADLADAVLRAREERGWSQATLAEKADVYEKAVGRIERRDTTYYETVWPVLKALNISFVPGLQYEADEKLNQIEWHLKEVCRLQKKIEEHFNEVQMLQTKSN